MRVTRSKMEGAMYRAMVSSEILTAIFRVKYNFKIPSGVFAKFQSYFLQYCILSNEKCQKINIKWYNTIQTGSATLSADFCSCTPRFQSRVVFEKRAMEIFYII